MIKPKHNNFWIRFSQIYTRLLFKFYFHKLNFIDQFTDTGKPIFMISNHFSFWDGFIQVVLLEKLINRKYHFMMLESELRKNMILRTIGAFSINKNNRDSIESLNFCAEVLKDKNNLLLIFPQGVIESIYKEDFEFESGLGYILKKVKNDIQFIFNVNLLHYGSNKKPEIDVYFENYEMKTKNVEEIQDAFNKYYKKCLNKQRQRND